MGTGALSAPVAWRAAPGHCHPSSVPWGSPSSVTAAHASDIPRGGQDPGSCSCCSVRGQGTRTRHQLALGSPWQPLCSPGRAPGLSPPSAMVSLGTATCPHPAAAVAWECPAATKPGQASWPPRLLVPEQAFSAQQVLGWALGIPGTAQDSPQCQHPAHRGAVTAPGTPCHNVPAPAAAAAASARGSVLTPEGLSKALGTPGLGGQQGLFPQPCSVSVTPDCPTLPLWVPGAPSGPCSGVSLQSGLWFGGSGGVPAPGWAQPALLSLLWWVDGV